MTVKVDNFSPETDFAKRLASNEKETRDEALKDLSVYLTSYKEEKPMVELLKLWKGLFYCMWMSDKPLIQQQLCNDLADLTLKLSKNHVINWLMSFWITMGREWPGIDKYRVDKFYLLMRRYISMGFRILQLNHWDKEFINEYKEMLSNGPLNPHKKIVTDAIIMHIADIYIDELEKLVDAQTIGMIPNAILFEPFCSLMVYHPMEWIRKYIRENVFDKLIQHAIRDKGRLAPVPYDLYHLSEILFEMGAKQDVTSSNRKHAYKLSALMKSHAERLGHTMKQETHIVQHNENDVQTDEETTHVSKRRKKTTNQTSEMNNDDNDDEEPSSTESMHTKSDKRVSWNLEATTVRQFRKQKPIRVMPEPIKPGVPEKGVLKRRPGDNVAIIQSKVKQTGNTSSGKSEKRKAGRK